MILGKDYLNPEDVFTFKKGGTILDDKHLVDGFRWHGLKPKVVPPNSTPSTCGGIGPNAWVYIGHRLS